MTRAKTSHESRLRAAKHALEVANARERVARDDHEEARQATLAAQRELREAKAPLVSNFQVGVRGSQSTWVAMTGLGPTIAERREDAIRSFAEMHAKAAGLSPEIMRRVLGLEQVRDGLRRQFESLHELEHDGYTELRKQLARFSVEIEDLRSGAIPDEYLNTDAPANGHVYDALQTDGREA